MTYNITLTANHQSLTAEYLPLAAESVQYLTVKVVCETEDWTGREIKAMFGQGCTVHEITVIDGEITAKQQLNLSAGDWCVWLVGNSARDGEVIPRITTNVAHISVAPTGGTEGNPFPNTPPTVEEQLRADMGNLADLTTKDKSSLVAAINETAEGGSKDAVKYTPQTLTDEQQTQARENIGAEKAGTSYTKAEIDSMNEYTGELINGLSVEVDNLDKAVDQRYTKPASGIPKSDLEQDVQTSLDKADAAISLGLTAATPGQIIKVKAVQDGKPTEWEAVDMPGGEEWELIDTIPLTQDVNSYVLAELAQYQKVAVQLERAAYVQGLSQNVWLKVYIDGILRDFYSVGYMTNTYGYKWWWATITCTDTFVTGTLQASNNENSAVYAMTNIIKAFDTQHPHAKAKLRLVFTDTSVIQDGDSVTVWGLKK